MNYIAFIFLLLLPTLIADNGAPSVSVPKSVNSCSPAPLDISGGTPPYKVSIVNADNPNGPALKEFNDVKQPSSLPWGSNLPAGTVITFTVKDSKGLTANSGQSSISSSNCPSPAQNQASTDGAGSTGNNFGDAIPSKLANVTGTGGPVNETTGMGNPAPVGPGGGVEGEPSNSSAPMNTTQASNPMTATNGSTTDTMGSSMNSTAPSSNSSATNNASSSSTPNISTPPKNPNQGGTVNVNNKNQTAKPPSSSSNRPTSSGQLKSFTPFSLFITPIVILFSSLIT